MHTKFWFENLEATYQPEELDVDEKIILEWMLGKQVVRAWTGCITSA
jgi:hypothetical protein